VLSFIGRDLIYFFIIILSVVRLNPLDTAAIIGLLYQPQMIDDGDCGVIDVMRIGRGKRSARVPLCPPQIPYDLTRASTVGSQRLTA
jgi:hypothetical protein